MCVNLICCDLCVCVGSINTRIDQRAGIGLAIVCVGVQEVSIVTNGSLPLITGPHTHARIHTNRVIFKHCFIFLITSED